MVSLQKEVAQNDLVKLCSYDKLLTIIKQV